MAENETFTHSGYAGDLQPVEPRPIAVGDAMLRIVMDSSSVDSFITRLERAVAAFKAEWNSEPKL